MSLTYEEAIQAVASKSTFGINLGLQRMEELLRRLGNPHKSGIVKYVHIAGTNGKGSTATFIQHILLAAGYQVGFFSSPHLHSYCERIRINGDSICQADVVSLVEKILPHVDAMVTAGYESPTEFEIWTAMALLYYTQKQMDWAVIETGLGGSIDSTNVILPEVSIITNVAMDHTDYLGNTIEEIATVKAGIIKKERPVITGCHDEKALPIIQERAAACQGQLWLYGRDFHALLRYSDENRQVFDCEVKGRHYDNLSTTLLGRYQVDNAALAVACADLLQMPYSAIQEGIGQAHWPGRMEVISRKPLIVLDGAHNVNGMEALAESLELYWPRHKILALFGMLADKEREKAMSVILPHISQVIVTKPPSLRAGNWRYLAELCSSHQVPTEAIEEIKPAVLRALELLEKTKADMLLVTGSLYMLGEARAFLLDLLRNK